jgi:AcrR family transcriptional regulator
LEKDQKIPHEKELRILEAASVLFARYGLRKTSIDEIAQQAGLGKGTIYLYFKSKEELFARIVQGFGDRLIEGLRQIEQEESDPREQLRCFIRVRMQFLADRMNEAGVSCEVMKEFEDTETSAPVAPIVQSFRAQQIQILEAILRRGLVRGAMRCEDAHMMATTMMCALEAFSRTWAFAAWEQTSLGAKMDTIATLFLRGVGSSSSLDQTIPTMHKQEERIR